MVTARRPPLALVLCVVATACLSGAITPAETVVVQAPASAARPTVALPNKDGSLKFGVIGDFGTGKNEQKQLADVMAKTRTQFPFELMLTVGDNIYGGEKPQDFVKKFETPYKALLDGGVKFYASLGNHDNRQQRLYEPFNMGGRTYYTFKAPREDVRFIAIESSYLDPAQIQWIERELQSAREAWKIPYFHHPLYSSARRHGSDLPKRKVLEPLFIKYGVSVVFAGHDHVYERVRPQNGIVHFVVGSSGQLRRGNLGKTDFTAFANATEHAFLVAEISGDEMYFQAIGRSGKVLDSGIIQRRKPDP
jgi:hypothetical protein